MPPWGRSWPGGTQFHHGQHNSGSVAEVAVAANSSSPVVRRCAVRGLLLLVLALVDRGAVELLAEVFLTSGAWLFVLPGWESLLATVAGILVCVLENLAAVIQRVRLCPFSGGLEVT